MVSVRHAITVPLSILSFVAVFYSVGKLAFFLSVPSKIQFHHVWMINLLDNWTRLESSLYPITIDALLIVLFVVEHSFLKTAPIKAFWQKLGLETAERSIYNLITAYTLVFVLTQWQPIPSYVLWNINCDSAPIWWTFLTLHAVAWLVIYGGSFIMDFPELTGVKQVYYDIKNLQTPSTYKSRELVRLYGHVRHPSFFGLSLILWVTNLMSLDRLLLALLWTTYMFVAWRIDNQDYIYHRTQYQIKKQELLGR